MVVIPAGIISLIVKGFVTKIISEMDLYSVKLVNLLVSREKGASE
jgi:Fe-S cluster assembly scaffold protein SufB